MVATFGAGAAAFALYRTTLLPGVFGWDTGEAQTVPVLAGTMHPTGFPAYVVLGWLASILLAPLGEPAFRMNLLSAILAATATAGMLPVLRRLGVPLAIAIAAAAGLAVTPITWRISAAADVHALHLLLVVLLVLSLLRWEDAARAGPAGPPGRAALGARALGPRAPGHRADRRLVLAAALFGVSLANHALTLLLAPAVGAYVLAVDRSVFRRPRPVLACAVACLGVAALLYLELPLRAGPFRAPLVYGNPDTWSGFWAVVLARQFQGSFAGSLAELVGVVHAFLRLTVDQLGVLALLVIPAFVVTAIRRPAYALLSGVATLLTCLFAAFYVNADIGRYYLGPAVFAWSWLAVLGAAVVDAVARRLPVRRRDLARGAAAMGVAVLLVVPTVTAFSARRDLVDRSADTEMAHWLDDAMDSLDHDAVVVSWWSSSTPLWYGTLVEGRRPDLRIVDDSTRESEGLGSVDDVIDANLGVRPVLVIRLPADLEDLTHRYTIEPVDRPSGVFRVTGRLEPLP
jgi:transmembrane protein TMEM260 (protein O-mannosyltransferase)